MSAGGPASAGSPPGTADSNSSRNVVDASRPNTSERETERDMEERSQFMIARVMSATEKRIARLLSASSAGSSRGSARTVTSVALTEYASSDGTSAQWAKAEEIISQVCNTWKLSDGWKFCIKRLGYLETRFLLEVIFSIPTRRRPVPNATASVLFSVDPGAGGFNVGSSRPMTTDSIDSQPVPPLRVGTAPPELAEKGVEGQAEFIVSSVVDAADGLVNSFIDDPSRPGSNLRQVLASTEVVFSVETQDLIHDAAKMRFSEQWLYDVLAAKRVTHDLADEILGPRPLA